MRFLQYPFIWEWCTEHGVPLDESGDGPPSVLPDPTLVHRTRIVFAPHGPVGYEPAVAEAIFQVLGAWDECLLWITQWGIWPSSEDWPRYYALRGQHGMRLSIEDAPGHLLSPGNSELAADLLLQVLSNGWDAELFPAQGGHVLPVRVHVSHDGWVRLDSASPVSFSVSGLETECVQTLADERSFPDSEPGR